MKTIAHLGGITRSDVGSDLFDALCRIYPSGQRGNHRHAFHLTLETDHPATQDVLQALATAGMIPWPGRRERRKELEFTLRLARLYEHIDLENLPFLELSPAGHEMHVNGEFRHSGRSTSIEAPCASDICIADMTAGCFVAVQRVRDALERAALGGLKFLPVEKQYESVDYNLYDEEDTWWELESDLELPPVAPSVQLVTRDYKPFRGDFTEGCQRIEDLQMYPELHYRRSDLDRFGPFDVARTHEHFFPKGPAPMHRAMIVSQKFYRVCYDNDFRTRFLPVHIDDE